MKKRYFIILAVLALVLGWLGMSATAGKYYFKKPQFVHLDSPNSSCPPGYDKMDIRRFKEFYPGDRGKICADCPEGYYFGNRGSRGTWCMKYK